MILTAKRLVIELEYRGVVPIEGPVGTSIECLRGRIWITEPGEPDDIVLEVGQSFTISRGGVVVMQGLSQGSVGIRAPTVRESGSWLATWIEQLGFQWATTAEGRHSVPC
jgi:hypothetical protein